MSAVIPWILPGLDGGRLRVGWHDGVCPGHHRLGGLAGRARPVHRLDEDDVLRVGPEALERGRRRRGLDGRRVLIPIGHGQVVESVR